jgi:hypothetical protein
MIEFVGAAKILIQSSKPEKKDPEPGQNGVVFTCRTGEIILG